MIPSPAQLDPDRFFNRTTPGAHEWWYFDAISDDGLDALVIVWYAGLPFDPSYGVATVRHLKNPAKHPQPRALDHSAIGFSWYRDGKPMAYALNGYRSDRFRHQAEPFSIEVAANRVERNGDEYKLTIATPSVEGRAIRAEIQFRIAGSTESFERNLGTPEAPHNWILAASDCRVEGKAAIGDNALKFTGRGYHDHNAGAEELSVAMKRWEWGRVHGGNFTNVYYRSEPRQGRPQSLWIVCRDGRPEVIRERIEVMPDQPRRTIFGIRHSSILKVSDRDAILFRENRNCIDDGPFYLRWLSDFRVEDTSGNQVSGSPGIAELLDTRNLHKPWFNWMIPYRLKRPVS